jgi:GntR family transcriptional regulator
VVKGYRQLDNDGLVTARPGTGHVRHRHGEAGAPGPHARLRRSLERRVREAYAAGLDDEMVTAMFATVRNQLRAEGVA